jgi:universal stress protein A
MKTDTILVPLDLTGCAAEVVDAVGELAGKLGSRVILMNVVQIPTGVNPYATLMMDEESWKTAREVLDHDAQAMLRPFHDQLVERGLQVGYVLGHGDVVSAILTATDDVSADMIVMGTHGRRGLERFVLGSVAEQVLRRSPCPVLTIKTHDPASHPGPSEARKKVEAETLG